MHETPATLSPVARGDDLLEVEHHLDAAVLRPLSPYFNTRVVMGMTGSSSGLVYAESFDPVCRKLVLVEHVDEGQLGAMEALLRFFYTESLCDKGLSESEISISELLVILKLADRHVFFTDCLVCLIQMPCCVCIVCLPSPAIVCNHLTFTLRGHHKELHTIAGNGNLLTSPLLCPPEGGQGHHRELHTMSQSQAHSAGPDPTLWRWYTSMPFSFSRMQVRCAVLLLTLPRCPGQAPADRL